MGKKLVINPGDKFGRLTIIREVEKRNKKRYFLCKCDCGNEKIIGLSNLRNKITRSCGCYHNETIAIKNKTHGQSKTRLYRTWGHMVERCNNHKDKRFKYYGGRGIKVCDEWMHDFMNFYNWAMDSGYEKDLTIDRKDVNGNYEPDNCRWATWKQQQNNRSNNHKVEYGDRFLTCQQWSEITKNNSATIISRLKKGWSIEDALFKKILR